MSYGPENLTEALQAILYLEARIIEARLEVGGRTPKHIVTSARSLIERMRADALLPLDRIHESSLKELLGEVAEIVEGFLKFKTFCTKADRKHAEAQPPRLRLFLKLGADYMSIPQYSEKMTGWNGLLSQVRRAKRDQLENKS